MLSGAERQARYRARHPEYRAREVARHRKLHRKRWEDPEYRERVLERGMHYRCTTAGILAQERHYQKRMRGHADV